MSEVTATSLIEGPPLQPGEGQRRQAQAASPATDY